MKIKTSTGQLPGPHSRLNVLYLRRATKWEPRALPLWNIFFTFLWNQKSILHRWRRPSVEYDHDDRDESCRVAIGKTWSPSELLPAPLSTCFSVDSETSTLAGIRKDHLNNRRNCCCSGQPSRESAVTLPS